VQCSFLLLIMYNSGDNVFWLPDLSDLHSLSESIFIFRIWIDGSCTRWATQRKLNWATTLYITHHNIKLRQAWYWRSQGKIHVTMVSGHIPHRGADMHAKLQGHPDSGLHACTLRASSVPPGAPYELSEQLTLDFARIEGG